MTKERPHRLVTLAFSHYNEKARWSLDWCGLAYDEKAYLPGFSQLGVMIATRGRGGKTDAVSSKFSAPIFLTSGGEELCDSTDIAEWASKQIGNGGPGPLFPTPDVREIVIDLGRNLGPYTRLVAYARAFRSETAMRTMAKKNVGRAQALAFRLLMPIGKPLLAKKLGVTKEGEARAVERVREEVRKMDARLEKTPYVVGEQFTAADITLAALLAPALLVQPEEGIGTVYPSQRELDHDTRELIAEMRGTRAGKHALRMFREHRRKKTRSIETNVVSADPPISAIHGRISRAP
jgi:glutathione S-transferase